jgi:isoleucyl-tRNA synthetase
MSEIMRKVRTTARFMLGNLHDFTHKDSINYADLKEVRRQDDDIDAANITCM